MKQIVFISLLFFTSTSFSQCACCDSLHTQFHFWVGDWNVYNPGGNLVGTNTLSLVEDSCVMKEQWKSASSGVTGTSYNFYNRNDKKWHQHWIDNQGGVLNLEGGMVGTSMVLLSKPYTDPNGRLAINRVIWTPDDEGNVRQLWESSFDGGQSWTTVFDGLYKPKK